MTTRRAAPQQRRSQAGLTLVEMLVALVILGFVMTLVAEVVFQVSQVARAADSVTRGSTARWAGGWSASGLIANLLAPEETGAGPPLTGSNRMLRGFTSQPLDGGERGIEAFELELRPAAGTGAGTELLAAGDRSARDAAAAAVVAVYPGRAEFAYIDLAGQTQLTWPPLARSEQDVEALPQAVIVRDADSGRLLMWYGFQGEITQPKPSVGLLDAAPR